MGPEVISNYPGLLRIIPSNSKLFQVIPSYFESFKVIPGHSEAFQAIPSHSELFRVQLDPGLIYTIVLLLYNNQCGFTIYATFFILYLSM